MVSVPHALCSFSNLLLLQAQEQAWLLCHFVEEETEIQRKQVLFPRSSSKLVWELWCEHRSDSKACALFHWTLLPVVRAGDMVDWPYGRSPLTVTEQHPPSNEWKMSSMKPRPSSTTDSWLLWKRLSLFFFFFFVVNSVIHWNEKALGSHYPWVFWTLSLYNDNLVPPHTNYRMVMYLPKALILHC